MTANLQNSIFTDEEKARETDYVASFMGSVWKRNTAEQRAALFLKLSNEPELQKAVARRRESRGKRPATPPLPPQQGGRDPPL
jgi:hypothetical protein